MSSIISCGDVRIKLLFPLIGGVGKCLADSILYKFKLEINKHPFILGINAALGMCLSIIPLIWMKIKNKGVNDPSILNDKNLYKEEYINRYSKPKIKFNKTIIIVLSSFLDFLQKILTFLLSKNIESNIWAFDILFLNIFSICILKTKLYRHQYFSIITIIILGIILNIINFYIQEDNKISFLWLPFLIEISYCLSLVLNKYGMEYWFCTPYEISFYEGLFALIINIILLIIFSNIKIPENSKIIEFFNHPDKDPNIYLDNFHEYYKKLKASEIIAFIINMISRGIFNLFSIITVYEFTPSHVIFLLILGEVQFAFKGGEIFHIVIIITIYCFLFFMTLIFTEIIEINLFGLEKNTKKNIKARISQNENIEENESGLDIDLGNISIALPIISEDNNSINN